MLRPCNISRLLVSWALMAGLSACASTPAQRIAEHPDQFASFPAEAQEKIRRGEINIGFTRDMVRMALGQPSRVATRTEADGVTAEIWVYEVVRPYHDDYGYYGRHYRYPYGPRGWRYGYHLYDDHDWVTYPSVRVEFTEDRVSAIERIRR